MNPDTDKVSPSVRQRGNTFALQWLGWSEVALSLSFAVFLTLGFHD